MSENQEKKPLLSDDDGQNTTGSLYNAENVSGQPSTDCASWLKKHKEKIPGYGLWTMLRQASAYMLYVLFIMLLVYLTNQLNRFTISITAKYVGPDLGFGEKACIPNVTFIKEVLHEEGLRYTRANLIKHYYPRCAKFDPKKMNVTCGEFEIEIDDYNETACKTGLDGSVGLKYQILAGPVFNNIYPFVGVFMGILADRFNRKILLGLSLLFWSLATGATGFSQNYWMVVLFRMLLAIGSAGCTPFAVSIISDYYPVNLRGTAIGIYYSGIYFGYSLSYAIGNSVNIFLGWRWVFFISGLIGVALVPFVIFTVKEPKRNNEEKGDKKTTAILNSKHKFQEFMKKMLLLLRTFIMPGMLMLCIAGGIRNAGGYVWGYNTQPFFQKRDIPDTTIASFMSVIPLVGGTIGAITGGIISDVLVKGRGPVARIWVLIGSQLIAAPFAAGALFLPVPWCFLSLIPSNVFGEMWIGVASAMIVDLAPAIIRTSSIALYLFIITIIGGNFNILVPYLTKALKPHLHGSDKAVERNSLRWAVFLTFPALYVVSSILFIFAFLLMRIDIKLKVKNEELSLNRTDKKTQSGSDSDA